MSDFRELMSHCAKSVYILTTNFDGNLRLTTISSVVSLEVDDAKPQILFIAKLGLASELQKFHEGSFFISLLSSKQKHVAELCSKNERQKKDFELLIHQSSSKDIIEISESIFTLECKMMDALQSQTNEVIIAGVIGWEARESNLSPLVHYRRSYLTVNCLAL
jgi:flavin reductase (DIM6/NTAB) family NADH-FMN oxidoreductase RutF